MKRDPRPRKDGRCARKGCKKQVPKIALLHNDPFCSSTCASAWHEIDPKFPVVHRWALGTKTR